MTTAEQIGQQIREARGELSARSLSQQVGVTPPTIASYEAGRTIPTADVLAKIADALNIPVMEVDEHRFTITRKERLRPEQPSEQLALDFSGEYSFSRATVRLSPGRISISFDGATPLPGRKVS